MVLEIWPPAPFCPSLLAPRLAHSGRIRRRPSLRFAESRSRHSVTLPPARSLRKPTAPPPLSEKAPPIRRAGLPAVRRPNADPGVPDLLIVHLRIVDHDIQSQSLHRQSADCRQQRVRSNNPIVLRGHQSHARINEFLLRIEDVE